ncbi:hypothetical protein SAMD00019534_026030 [Acytostelium subglobosum LB1]|uniref:hypothetical protein n=1 Tax=Acytostelium subglobosum LB1 TaxID=1410327 RepID=UPI000644964C|nr:hypothetical protein SAMD00019534_026030 [Acytostelium subglobosum LB1]GAM19428.1 hypothetical protein SAMD00019534_026030 [Acytostelium subglobosum LB1]|eukprot:XP_012757355.1 hypothetical protein SAMD00019534_026030 [Acytostelium subglobosum LB1]
MLRYNATHMFIQAFDSIAHNYPMDFNLLLQAATYNNDTVFNYLLDESSSMMLDMKTLPTVIFKHGNLDILKRYLAGVAYRPFPMSAIYMLCRVVIIKGIMIIISLSLWHVVQDVLHTIHHVAFDRVCERPLPHGRQVEQAVELLMQHIEHAHTDATSPELICIGASGQRIVVYRDVLEQQADELHVASVDSHRPVDTGIHKESAPLLAKCVRRCAKHGNVAIFQLLSQTVVGSNYLRDHDIVDNIRLALEHGRQSFINQLVQHHMDNGTITSASEDMIKQCYLDQVAGGVFIVRPHGAILNDDYMGMESLMANDATEVHLLEKMCQRMSEPMARLIASARAQTLRFSEDSLFNLVRAVGKPGSNITADIVCQFIVNHNEQLLSSLSYYRVDIMRYAAVFSAQLLTLLHTGPSPQYNCLDVALGAGCRETIEYLFQHLDEEELGRNSASTDFTDEPNSYQLVTIQSIIEEAYVQGTHRIIKLCQEQTKLYTPFDHSIPKPVDTDIKMSDPQLESAIHSVFGNRKLIAIIMGHITNVHRSLGANVIKGSQLLDRHCLFQYINYGAAEWFLKYYKTTTFSSNLHINFSLLESALSKANVTATYALLRNPIMSLMCDKTPSLYFIYKVSACTEYNWRWAVELYTLITCRKVCPQLDKDILLHVHNPLFIQFIMKLNWTLKPLANNPNNIARINQIWLSEPYAVDMLVVLDEHSLISHDLEIQLLIAAIELNITLVVKYFVEDKSKVQLIKEQAMDKAQTIIDTCCTQALEIGRMDIVDFIFNHMDTDPKYLATNHQITIDIQAIHQSILSVELLERLIAHPKINWNFSSLMGVAIKSRNKAVIEWLEQHIDTNHTNHLKARLKACEVGDLDMLRKFMSNQSKMYTKTKLGYNELCSLIKRVGIPDSTVTEETIIEFANKEARTKSLSKMLALLNSEDIHSFAHFKLAIKHLYKHVVSDLDCATSEMRVHHIAPMIESSYKRGDLDVISRPTGIVHLEEKQVHWL